MNRSRRTFLLAAGAGMLAAPALAQQVVRIPAEWLPTNIDLNRAMEPGVIHVDIENTWLFYTLTDTVARRYKIAVGAAGQNFRGTATVRRKAEWPSWTPTANMIAREPEVYAQSAGGLPGGRLGTGGAGAAGQRVHLAVLE